MTWCRPEIDLRERELGQDSLSSGWVAVVGIIVGAGAFVYCQERFGTGLRIDWDGWRPTSIRCR